MKIEQALAEFDLKRLLPIDVMREMWRDKVKKARASGDEEWEKRLHGAWAILSGKEPPEAPQAAAPAPKPQTGPSGTERARCGERSGQEFVLDWRARLGNSSGSVDEIVFTNPQTIAWDGEIDSYVVFDGNGGKKPYQPFTGLRKAGEGTDASGWASDRKARVSFENARCPVCQAPHLQKCDICLTIFCRRDEAHYKGAGFRCPKCQGHYNWGAGVRATEQLFDGKQLRSLMQEERKEIGPPGNVGKVGFVRRIGRG